MKRISCILLCLLLMLSCLPAFADDLKVLTASDLTEKFGDVNIVDGKIEIGGNFKRSTMGFKADLTGVKSITIKAEASSAPNGEIFRVRVDDHNAVSIGDVVFVDGDTSARANIEEQVGVHTIYFSTTLSNAGAKWRVSEVVLHSDAKVLRVPTTEADIIDNWHDTWAATDSFGRKVADYEEVGSVKTDGERNVGIFYWFKVANTTGVVSDILRDHPDAWNNFEHPGWKHGGKNMTYYWAEPAIGFYSQWDYWVMRRHAIQLANAGIDVVYFDYTNDFWAYSKTFKQTMQVFTDAMAEGIDAPKIGGFGAMSSSKGAQDEMVPVMYYNQIATGEWDDTIFYHNGKPMHIMHPFREAVGIKTVTDDKDLVDFVNTVETEMDLVGGGEERGGNPNPEYRFVNWLEEYPQHPFGVGASGRPEFINIGVAINQAYAGSSGTGVFSDPYAKGRGYSEAFGEDYSADGPRKGYFFRESAAHVLEVDPEFIFVDGWNELAIPIMQNHFGFTGTVFVDTLDPENSRDFEPTRSLVKDDYYNMLADFIRKYKGVRPAPLATAPVTININGDASQWANVGPTFYHDNDDVDRNFSGGIDFYTGETLHYETKIYNSIENAKVARDSKNFYFYVKTRKAIQTGTPGWMNIYINTDRNYATGWEGFDYAINLNGAGVLSKASGNTWAWENIGTVAYTVQGDVLQIAVPKTLIGETGVVEFEFKVTDNCITDGDYIDFYSEGSVAPLGKFNYLYTEIEQTALTEAERKALDGASIFKAGVSKAIIEGGKMPTYERDLRITPFEMNGTLYIPSETLEEVLGYGNAKVEYTFDDQTLYVERYDLVKKTHPTYAIENQVWTYAKVGAYEGRKNGTYTTLSNPIVTGNGLVYVPLTYIAEMFGWNVQALGGGAYIVSRNAIDTALATSVLHHIK